MRALNRGALVALAIFALSAAATAHSIKSSPAPKITAHGNGLATLEVWICWNEDEIAPTTNPPAPTRVDGVEIDDVWDDPIPSVVGSPVPGTRHYETGPYGYEIICEKWSFLVMIPTEWGNEEGYLIVYVNGIPLSPPINFNQNFG